MLTKTCDVVQVKAGPADGLDDGQFEALVSVFNVKDSYGDVVIPGAFTDTLNEWKSSGNPLPVVWSHMYQDPDYHIGVVLDAKETTVGSKAGLWVKGQLDLDDDAKKARQVGRLLKGRRVTQFSYSYEPTDYGFAKSEEFGDYLELRRIKLYEVGPTLIGANQDTELINAKALREALVNVKAGRVLSAKNESALREAATLIGTVLSALDDNSNDGKASTGEPGKVEDRVSGKTEDPMRHVTAELDALGLDLDLS